MKLYLVFAVLLIALHTAYGIPVDDFVDINDVKAYGSDNAGIRQRRVTCDLLSFKGVVGDSACAANCLSMGKAGGRCNAGICECRTTKIKDLWDKRFD